MNLIVPILALSAASFVMVTIPTFLRGVLPRLTSRMWYRDGLCYVAVRSPGEWREIREFVQPDNALVINQAAGDAWSCLDWVCRNISYRREFGEFWQFPSETLRRGQGDCEDSSILLASMIRRFTNAYVVLGSYRGLGHAWVAKEGEILEATYTEAIAVPDPDNYYPHFLFNDQEIIELWPGALSEVFELRRQEVTKLNLMATALT